MAHAKSRLLAKGRSIARDIRRYAAFGYVTRIEDWESDDRKLTRAVDSLYDLARKHGLGEDVELQQVRMQLFRDRVEARERARVSRQQEHTAVAGAFDRSKVPPGMKGYLDELKLDEQRRRARRGGG